MFNASQLLNADYNVGDLRQLRNTITENYIVDEHDYLNELITYLDTAPATQAEITRTCEQIVKQVRSAGKGGSSLEVGIDAFLQEYSLDTEEGIILMCLAEALLRIPDSETADALIKDKLKDADWSKHFRQSDSVLVNASTWGLMLTGKIINLKDGIDDQPTSLMNRLVGRVGEPVIRKAMYAAMQIMGKQFVLGRDINEALKTSRQDRKAGYTHSYDMLGEAALTQKDAEKYFNDYIQAIEAVGSETLVNEKVSPPTVSIKLSALHPRYEVANEDRVMSELLDTVLKLAHRARSLNVGLTIDAEEADRLELSLSLYEALYRHEQLRGWGNLGIVVQAYSKRCLPVLIWLTELAREQGDKIPLRLVKGAYWDSEIKECQQAGIAGYPVFTRKASTDVSYLACAKYLLSDRAQQLIYPQFATHNAHTVASIQALASNNQYEFQRLHGMGDELYDTVMANSPINCRIYAPVGAHKDLLPYLVRRLLENGANTSFVHKLVDPNTPVESLCEHPLKTLAPFKNNLRNEKIVLAPHIYGKDRLNSAGVNLNIESEAKAFFDKVYAFDGKTWKAASIINGAIATNGTNVNVVRPQNHSKAVGEALHANAEQAKAAVDSAYHAFHRWHITPVEQRANALDKIADALEANKHELIALCTFEAGKSLQDGIDEVREAVDFCRYYANQARRMFNAPIELPGPTGEGNTLAIHGRGVFVCISPWNFPLAIFLGQVVAALVTGNTVVAKPAEQTSLVAFRAVQMMHEAGIPSDALQLVLGTGAELGDTLTSNNKVAGVCFTGSTGTAQRINRTLAARDGAIATLIAETGGQNALIVDSTSLPEQVINDVVSSAFQSAGQRCSACRVMYVQDDIAGRVIELLDGAMQELSVGDPAKYKTDVGPVIDKRAQDGLNAHIQQITKSGKLLSTAPMPEATQGGTFVQPTAVEISRIDVLEKEHFGPILHVIRYKANELDNVIDAINNTGFGLTLGIHTRNESKAQYIAARVNVGNVYINRNQIGAVVGVQPFGGHGLSGTGPKAGGPNYLYRFITEKTVTNNLTAIGGNATLLTLGEG